MKLKIIIPALLIALAGCSQKVRTIKTEESSSTSRDSLYVTLSSVNIIKAGQKVNLRFVIHNENSTGKSFCKWHTPFEPLMSKYLDIKDEQGNEAAYTGPMAKRMMPPPIDSYLTVNPKDTLVANVDLRKAYQLEAGKKYTVHYNSSAISGLKISNNAIFTIQN
ncbi:hypothetical protein [Pedobacter sp. Leaf176]|uniref:hypothetical protein n=1 Tax=Pedobacter sp. Leaf176 TaxID=1736286 RepID=UPI0006F52EA5|nr:hypothetical protein [Pedobacter sp. Leaf176]KQR71055.1 hypothetical protein ASF92_06555 [Pedobacter sp. Leaf176]